MLSLDIRITSAGKETSAIPGAGAQKKDDLEWVVVEILTVEIPEPRRPEGRRRGD
jgi:hypothetical protein